MRLLVGCASIVASALAGSAARAADTPKSGGPADYGLALGLRLGYGFPLGNAIGAPSGGKGEALGDDVTGMAPIWIDLGYRVSRRVYVGAYGQYAFAFTPSQSCPSGASCSASDLRVGLDVAYSLVPEGDIKPWLAVGAGYEILSRSVSVGSSSTTGRYNGFELLNVQAGADYALTPNLGVGPFLSFSFAQFSGGSFTSNGQASSIDITSTAFHEWLIVGIRGQYAL